MLRIGAHAPVEPTANIAAKSAPVGPAR